MIYAAISPAKALESTFGESLSGPVAELVVRNWGLLIAMGGGMLIYAAFRPSLRPLALVFTGLGKVFFIAQILQRNCSRRGFADGDSVRVVFAGIAQPGLQDFPIGSATQHADSS